MKTTEIPPDQFAAFQERFSEQDLEQIYQREQQARQKYQKEIASKEKKSWFRRHPILTTLGAGALLYFLVPSIVGLFPSAEAAAGGTGLGWWEKLKGAIGNFVGPKPIPGLEGSGITPTYPTPGVPM